MLKARASGKGWLTLCSCDPTESLLEGRHWRDGKDHAGPLPIKDAKGAAVGELACTLTAVAALTPLAAASGKAPSAALASSLGAKVTLALSGTVRLLPTCAHSYFLHVHRWPSRSRRPR